MTCIYSDFFSADSPCLFHSTLHVASKYFVVVDGFGSTCKDKCLSYHCSGWIELTGFPFLNGCVLLLQYASIVEPNVQIKTVSCRNGMYAFLMMVFLYDISEYCSYKHPCTAKNSCFAWCIMSTNDALLIKYMFLYICLNLFI